MSNYDYAVVVKKPGVFTPREEQVLDGLARGLSVPQISEWLGMSSHTAHRHCKHIYKRMEVDEARGNARMTAIGRAIAEGVIAIIKQ